SGFYKGQSCGFQGGYIPFAKTRAERLAKNDPRLSLEERYGTHEHYVEIVKAAAAKLVAERFLLPADAERLIHEAEASDILK
ncbi:MAG TPA: alpha/beta hydrolase domain-containing protein, partial [Bryobacteraceae bacterium]|nr:alpha/beta hydrolase domain-containing protein [Bryobacteraceae bacterium]